MDTSPVAAASESAVSSIASSSSSMCRYDFIDREARRSPSCPRESRIQIADWRGDVLGWLQRRVRGIDGPGCSGDERRGRRDTQNPLLVPEAFQTSVSKPIAVCAKIGMQ